jgi:hypothetical protein
MPLRPTASNIAALLFLTASPLASWAAECTDRQCQCFGESDCAILFHSGQCQAGTEVKRTTESVSLCTLETKKITVGQCQQVSAGRDVLILNGESNRTAELPHISKSCGG